jgi:hypothetical protein
MWFQNELSSLVKVSLYFCHSTKRVRPFAVSFAPCYCEICDLQSVLSKLQTAFPPCFVEALKFCNCVSIACQKPEFSCSRICRPVTPQTDRWTFSGGLHSFFGGVGGNRSLFKILAPSLVACSKLCTVDTQMLGTTIQIWVACVSLAQWNKWATFLVVVMYFGFYAWEILIVRPS